MQRYQSHCGFLDPSGKWVRHQEAAEILERAERAEAMLRKIANYLDEGKNIRFGSRAHEDIKSVLPENSDELC